MPDSSRNASRQIFNGAVACAERLLTKAQVFIP